MTDQSVSRNLPSVNVSSHELVEFVTGETGITASQLFDRQGTSRIAKITVASVFVIFLVGIIWAAVMPIAEISASSGEIVPSGAVQKIQHLEGGIVSKLLVEEGQHVEQGQTLIELAPNIAAPELDQYETRLISNTLRIRSLTVALQGGTFDVETVDPQYQDIARAENLAIAAKRQSIGSQITVLTQQLNERKAELAAAVTQKGVVKNRINLTKEQIEGRQTLVEKGLYPRMELIEDERDLARLDGERIAIDMNALRIQERIREAESRIVELDSKFKSELATELSELTNTAAELRLAINRAEDRVNRLKVVSPLSGRVQGMMVRTIGGVIAPGATLLDIVPDGKELHVEARISTSDIGHVVEGQEAIIKVLTYDYTTHGAIKGLVSHISPSTFSDEDGMPYYKAHITLSALHVGNNPDLQIGPGMTVLADIVTGEKTLLSYLLSPIIRTFDAALHER